MGETLDYLQELYDKYKKPELEFNGICHDCKKITQIVTTMAEDNTISASGGSIYKTSYFDIPFFKCETCFKSDPNLRNYIPCEVYSRITGYLRPVKQFNPGKKEEFKIRTNFKF